MFFKAKRLEQQKTKLQKRVGSLSTEELFMWADQATYSAGRNLSTWQKTSEKFYLKEAKLAAESLYAITDELTKRHTSG